MIGVSSPRNCLSCFLLALALHLLYSGFRFFCLLAPLYLKHLFLATIGVFAPRNCLSCFLLALTLHLLYPEFRFFCLLASLYLKHLFLAMIGVFLFFVVVKFRSCLYLAGCFHCSSVFVKENIYEEHFSVFYHFFNVFFCKFLVIFCDHVCIF